MTLLVLACLLHNCTPVKPYQRAYLNDAAMRPGSTGIEKFDTNVHSIREGASGGGNGKTSGGCGCN
ncbi:MAG: DUF4266 domain-containing protein [Sphingobacteriales bacterium]|nr:DUF4266 domain-containing protein [Sphingobacteriales bacterium]